MKKIKGMCYEEQKNKKVLFIVGKITAVIIIILAFMQILGVSKISINVFEALLCILMLIQGLNNLKKNNGVSIFSFLVAAIIFASTVFLLITK